MKSACLVVCAALASAMVWGCASSSSLSAMPTDCPFAKVAPGMTIKHVYDLIGPPTDTNFYRTGKMWIPFYFGDDHIRTEAHYKGIGRITFAGLTPKVIRVEYDPTERGYPDK